MFRPLVVSQFRGLQLVEAPKEEEPDVEEHISSWEDIIATRVHNTFSLIKTLSMILKSVTQVNLVLGISMGFMGEFIEGAEMHRTRRICKYMKYPQ